MISIVSDYRNQLSSNVHRRIGVYRKSALVIAVLAVAAGVGWHFCCKTEVKTPPPSEDAWWGPGKPAKDDEKIRPFKINISDEILTDLNYRLDHTRPLTPPLEGIHFEYGFNTDTLKKIIKFWRTDYKWREREVFLNSLPQFTSQMQGLDIHFIHVKPDLKKAGVKRAVPLLLLHGWPGSVREFYSLIPLLTEKPLNGADFVFEVIAPSLPGYGFSQSAVRPGLGGAQTAVLFAKLMTRLGHDKWYIQGGDWGSQVASYQAHFYPQHVMALHLNMCTTISPLSRLLVALGALWPRMIVGEEFEKELYPYWTKLEDILLETGYLHIQATKPDTIGVAMTDSPAGLAAYLLEKFSTGTNRDFRSVKDGGLLEQYTYTDLLDNVMLYWVTGTATTSFRFYAESFAKSHRDLQLDVAKVNVPLWCSQFRTELGLLPAWILRTRYPQLRHVEKHDFGGHFAAFEQPQALAQDVWDAFTAAESELKTPKKN